MALALVLFIPLLLMSVVAHEVAHAWQARREGDRTAEALGRITLNPLPHLDLWGSLLVPALLFVGGGVLFGWAKPVPVDPRNFRSHPWSDIRVSLAGIVANLLLATAFTLAAALAMWTGSQVPGWAGAMDVARDAIYYGIFLNLLLAFFNLLPIPPLDGSHVLYHVLPRRIQGGYRRLGAVGVLLLMAVVFLFPDLLAALLTPVNVMMGVADAFVRLWI
jgi:Zn-dependent protease